MDLTSLVQVAEAVTATDSSLTFAAGKVAICPSEMLIALERCGAFAAIAFSAIGSAFGCGIAATAAIASWKRCYLTNKPAPFQLLIFAGAPFSQVIYGMVLMFFMLGKIAGFTDRLAMDTDNAVVLAGQGLTFLAVGIFGGIAIGFCSYFQGVASAGACDAQSDTGKGFALYLMALGIIETVSIFAMVFAIVLLG